jgi:hypothetical protein
MVAQVSQLQCDLERQIQVRTGRRIRDLAVELTPGLVVLRGHTTTYYLKQMAQTGVRDLLPLVRLENDIVVDSN